MCKMYKFGTYQQNISSLHFYVDNVNKWVNNLF